MMRAAITGVGYYLPEDILSNAELEKLVDTNDEWIRSRTGISERRILRDPEKATSYMATRAVRNLLEKKNIDPEEIDLIIVGTVTPDMVFPATACLVQAELGATNAFGFDLSAACSGFLYALQTGAQFIQAGTHKKVIVIGADKMSSIIDYTDRTTCILFGDGAGAVLLEPDETGVGIVDSLLQMDGTKPDLLCMPAGGSRLPSSHETVDARQHFVYQEGRSVFKYAVKGMADAAATVMERNNLTGDDIAYLVPLRLC
jgi:3-oxoacyl-[acyl-carrier-protein] synthase-3